MPSPFPGMDPYLEAPHIWPDFHHRLASELSTEFNGSLPSPYYARLEMRRNSGSPRKGSHGNGSSRMSPWSATHATRPTGGAAVIDRPRGDISTSLEFVVHSEAVRHYFVEIRDSSEGHKLITLIENLSPSNKRPAPIASISEQAARCARERRPPDRDRPVALGRPGLARSQPDRPDRSVDPPADYLVLVNRAWRRGEGSRIRSSPFGLREWLPCIPVPLKQDEPEVPLDLQFVFNRAYDGGPYRRGAIDFEKPPEPPLSGDDDGWAEGLWRGGGVGSTSLQGGARGRGLLGLAEAHRHTIISSPSRSFPSTAMVSRCLRRTNSIAWATFACAAADRWRWRGRRP